MLDMSNTMNTASKLSRNESQTDTLTERQYSLTCVSSFSPVQPNSIEELRTLLLAAHPVRVFQWPGSNSESVTKGICGPQQSTLFGLLDLPAFCLKTYLACSDSSTQRQFSHSLPAWGMISNMALYPQPMWEPDTLESDCGLLEREPDGVNFHHTPNTSGMDGGSNSRRALAKRQANWPTPQAADDRDRGNMSNPCIQRRADIGKQLMLSQVVDANSGALNPDWVEWLMGWPVSWTDIKPLAELTWRDWQTDPADTGEVPRVTDVKENRANRLKAIGNGQVPQCVVKAWELLS